MGDICRVLRTDVEAERFVEGILDIENTKEKRTAINSITAAERNISDYERYSTFTQCDNRDFKWRDNKKRKQLRQQIIDELYKMERLDNDELIKLGKGGSKPKTDVDKYKAFYVIGSPASGKSGISVKLADKFNAYLLDSDFAKRKLPEYKNQIAPASLVHEESGELVYNTNSDSLMTRCLNNNYSMVIPKIGDDVDKVIKLCAGLRNAGYSVYLISVDLDRKKTTLRAYYRYKETGRYVPLSLIFDKYGNQPSLSYFRIKQQHKDIFSGFAQISTDVPKGSPAILLEEENLPELKDIDWR